MAKIYPATFNSFEEYDTYFSCIKKAQVGDKVEAYFRLGGNGGYSPSVIKTDFTKKVYIGGIKYEKEKDKFGIVFILGTDEDHIGFYPPENRLKDSVPNFPYKFMYYGFTSDIRYSKIIKMK